MKLMLLDMPKLFLILFLWVFLQGCAYTPQFGLSGGIRQIDGHVTDVGCLDITQQFQGKQYLRLDHCSDPGSGRYLLNNNKPDTSVETLTYRKYFGGEKRN